MDNQWGDILETYHLSSCPAPNKLCKCRLCEVIEGIIQLEGEIERIKEIHRQEDNALAGHIKRLESENERLRSEYNELIFAVAKKCPNETRHETALRYIQEREQRVSGPSKEIE